MPIGPEYRTRAYGDAFENAALYTNPGMASFAVPGSPHRCGGCAHWRASLGASGKGRCAAYSRLMRGKRGAVLSVSQTACKLFEAGGRRW
jgi:hypothetical protein